MKPSVARKLNERIRQLEEELERLRSDKKVSELEKKVTVRSRARAVCVFMGLRVLCACSREAVGGGLSLGAGVRLGN